MDDEFAFGIIVGIILFLAGLLALWAYFFVEPVPPRAHIFYCYDKSIDVYFPCRERDDTIIDIRHQPPRIS